MGNEPSTQMDDRRLELFNRAANEMTGGVISDVRWNQTVCADLGLVESQAIDIINRFFTFFEDMLYLIRNGFIQAAPDEDDPEVVQQLIEMSACGLIDAGSQCIHEFAESDELQCDNIAQIPICADGVPYLEVAIEGGMYIEFFITNRTTVGDVIEFIKQVELMETPPRLVSNADMAAVA